MQNILNYSPQFTVTNLPIYVNQGRYITVGSGYPVNPNSLSNAKLAPSTNALKGYDNGQMLAVVSGVLAGGGASTLAALKGQLINFDPNSLDTGQAKWNGFVICDDGIKQTLPQYTSYPNLNVASPVNNWTLRVQFLYAGGNIQTDAAAVKAALLAYAATDSITFLNIANSANGYEDAFSY